MEREQIHPKLKSLVQKFEANKYHYLSKNYLEEEVKIDFINPLFEALGWDVRNTKGLSPYEREVVVEKGETIGRPDYNFRIDGQTKFFVEAKAPHEPLHKINHVLQAKSYAWNTKNVFIVLLTDFEEFRLFDATIKPDLKNPDQGLIFELTYDQYLDNIDKLMLLSKEEVEKGSLDKLILKDAKSRKLRIPVDKAFLEDLSQWREELAKDIYKRNIKELEDRSDEKRVKIQVKILNEAVQKILDRLIFIRIAEDRKIIEPKSLLDQVEWWKAGGKRRDLHRRLTNCFMGWNQDFNGEILKPGPCDVLETDSNLLAKIIDGLYFPKCPYRFDVIGVELLGSIYERYLGKTIRVTPKRVKIEEKPEVRKAGGVYYTPQYIVDYIVKNTVGKIIKGKTLKKIDKIKILDPACGSGSFLLNAFQTLIDYHLDYYEKHPDESGRGTLFPDLIVNYDGTKRLSIEKKVQILRNNIFGVDIDPQAVEIAMMSLYLKCLEGEKDLPRKRELLPSLAKNIRCGNSLISYDIFDQLTLFDEEEKERINPFDWHSKSTGFGGIMEKGGFDVVIGNPPYGAGFSTQIKNYLYTNYPNQEYQLDSYLIFLEKGLKLLKFNGILGYIIPNTWLINLKLKKIRRFIVNEFSILNIVHYIRKIFPVTVDTEILIIQKSDNRDNKIKINITSKEEKVITKFVNQNKWKELDGGVLNIFISEKDEGVLANIRKKTSNLEKFCKITQGTKPFQTGKGKPPQTKEIVKNKPFVSTRKENETFKPLLRGSNINRFEIKWNMDYWISYGNWLAEPRYSASFDAKEKIVIRQTGDTLIATLDTEQFIVRDNLYTIIFIDERYNLRYFLGLINSKVLDYFYQSLNPEKGEALAQVKRENIAKLPIQVIDFKNPKEKSMHDKMVDLVDKMLELNKKKIALPPSSKRDKIEREIQITDEKIDELVYELYGISEKERKIIEARGKDIDE